MMALKDCVSGVLVRKGRFLVEKRSTRDRSDPGRIAIPGGHLEGHETHEEALKREMKEELGVEVLKVARLRIGHHLTTDGERQRIRYFHVKSWRGRLRAGEADALYWESDVTKLYALADKRAVVQALRIRPRPWV